MSLVTFVYLNSATDRYAVGAVQVFSFSELSLPQIFYVGASYGVCLLLSGLYVV